MARFHNIKGELALRLPEEEWESLFPLLESSSGMEYIAPLLGFLPRGGVLRWRAVRCLGVCMAALASRDMEQARGIMRRFMWHMNEESGNLGWGVPESMGEVLSQSPPLAVEFNRVLFSYITNTGRDDNYIDHAPLLQACFWGCGRLAQARPDYGAPALPAFAAGLGHSDAQVRGQAALGLFKLLGAQPALARALDEATQAEIYAALSAMQNETTECEDFDGKNFFYRKTKEIAQEALGMIKD